MKIVEKWIAGWSDLDTVIIMKYPFRETSKMFCIVHEKSPECHWANVALNYPGNYLKDKNPPLFDTFTEALQWLVRQERKKIANAKKAIERAQERCATIRQVIECL